MGARTNQCPPPAPFFPHPADVRVWARGYAEPPGLHLVRHVVAEAVQSKHAHQPDDAVLQPGVVGLQQQIAKARSGRAAMRRADDWEKGCAARPIELPNATAPPGRPLAPLQGRGFGARTCSACLAASGVCDPGCRSAARRMVAPSVAALTATPAQPACDRKTSRSATAAPWRTWVERRRVPRGD